MEINKEHEKLHNTIGGLMDEAANKTRFEIEALKKIFNNKLEKLIEECSQTEIVLFMFIYNILEYFNLII